MLSIVHVIERFASSGPERALLAGVKYGAHMDFEQQHTVCALEPAASPISILKARRLGVTVHRQPDEETLQRELAAAGPHRAGVQAVVVLGPCAFPIF